MKRYGDNLPSSSILDDELSYGHGRNVKVIYGGCGVRFGTFSRPLDFSQKRRKFDLRSMLGLRQESPKKDIA